MVYKSGLTFLPFCHNARVDRRTDGRTEISSQDRVCIPRSAVKTVNKTLVYRHAYHSASLLMKSAIPENTLQYIINV